MPACCRYEGAFSRGKRDGQGKYFYANGDSYEGQFKVRVPLRLSVRPCLASELGVVVAVCLSISRPSRPPIQAIHPIHPSLCAGRDVMQCNAMQCNATWSGVLTCQQPPPLPLTNYHNTTTRHPGRRTRSRGRARSGTRRATSTSGTSRTAGATGRAPSSTRTAAGACVWAFVSVCDIGVWMRDGTERWAA